MKGLPRHSHADGIDYLSTINTYLSIQWSVPIPTTELWRRLSTGNQSMFLDTMSELAWALEFHRRGTAFESEARFFPEPTKGANADFLIGPRGAGLWLDVNSMELAPPTRDKSSLPWASFPAISKAQLVSKLVGKAINKYTEKFNADVMGGPLKGQPTGLLLGLHKAEKESLPALMLGLIAGITEPVPDGLFSDLRPELALIWVYVLTRALDGTCLLPSLVFRWDHPGFGPGVLDWLSPGMVTVTMEPPPYDLSGLIQRMNIEARREGPSGS